MYRVWKYKLDHVAFWLITLLFYAFIRSPLLESKGWGIYLADVLTRNLLIASVCYLNIYYLFEQLFRRSRYIPYALALVVLLSAYSLLQNIADYWLSGTGDSLYKFYYHFSVGLFYVAFTLALELSKRWYRQQLLLHKVQAEKLQTELQYLKAQLNPHFLFNCINSIYFQIDPANAEARESLNKFCELLRYQLYECNEDRISIEKETSYLQSYVDLQRLRKNHNNRVLFHANENVKDFSIAPLLLLPFVENAFKHVSTFADAENIIEVNMRVQNGSFIFSISNTVGCDAPVSNGTGIGLKNVRRRLDLLYENRYTLDIERTPLQYTVHLQLDLL